MTLGPPVIICPSNLKFLHTSFCLVTGNLAYDTKTPLRQWIFDIHILTPGLCAESELTVKWNMILKVGFSICESWFDNPGPFILKHWVWLNLFMILYFDQRIDLLTKCTYRLIENLLHPLKQSCNHFNNFLRYLFSVSYSDAWFRNRNQASRVSLESESRHCRNRVSLVSYSYMYTGCHQKFCKSPIFNWLKIDLISLIPEKFKWKIQNITDNCVCAMVCCNWRWREGVRGSIFGLLQIRGEVTRSFDVTPKAI